MAPAWQLAHSVEIRCGAKIVEPSPNELSALSVVFPHEAFEIIAVIREVSVLEIYIHSTPTTDILTPRVNKSQAFLNSGGAARQSRNRSKRGPVL
jgi:hypothetical protein